jgi:ketosteroid isomerase-like protein
MTRMGRIIADLIRAAPLNPRHPWSIAPPNGKLNSPDSAAWTPIGRAERKTMNFEDKLAIAELIARYNHSIDGGDYETWVACWSEDAVLDGVGQYRVGLDAIRAFAVAYEQNHRSKSAGLRHFTFNIISDIKGDEATSRSYLQLTRTGAKGVQIIFTGCYEDVLIKRAGQWRFRSRKFMQDMPPAS